MVHAAYKRKNGEGFFREFIVNSWEEEFVIVSKGLISVSYFGQMIWNVLGAFFMLNGVHVACFWSN